MERDEFLKSLGIGLALVCTGSCFTACSKGGSEDEPAPGGNNNNGNTSSVDISTLASVGSQKTVNGVLFIRIAAGSETSAFVATEAICPHQGGNLNWQSNKIECDNHKATFGSNGTVLSQPLGGGTVRALKIYSTSLTGTTLTATKS
ncbi:Rieske 2Fe-2S domain-containing protein [Desertivirga arenae]|uniref:Rieske 2Fe-2S domain-containing protein n=1 Tax=Desertivirga arenae TaxID=2810309 RepID=UPI001A96989B|nr:Rieske 2Fe-2S domain-containing protein [Pedobacter sp. SYSU D00823]